MADKCDEAIAKQLKKRRIKRNADVRELYLGENKVTDVTDLSRFKNLYCLWLNSNKLRSVNCLSENFRLAELYLQNNEITTITGSLRHLTSLQVLFLHNNQLQKLEVVVQELENMQKLHTLNLFYNPVAQEPEYRQYVIYKIPSIELLDRQEVLKSEQDTSERMYNQLDTEIKDTIAFGRSPPYATEEQAITIRALRRSVMEYTSFGWSKVPSSLERRTSEKPFENPQLVTTSSISGFQSLGILAEGYYRDDQIKHLAGIGQQHILYVLECELVMGNSPIAIWI
ncbi:hypothetical protein LSH36_356g02050 [Paralvinella palmiformis]|uniref:Leucine-rich repeat-containing protein 72 n=1 Tax=Paralvinella palmiformis TaxID=53620 RepID=A0AAD9N153_9ANNE|nr:hypothetical protein LSH36_356g02050 [Paralvinella palmiformis]